MRASTPLLVSLVLVGSGAGLWAQDDGRISEFGRYEGWSEERFDGWSTTSRYLEMRDGVRLAVEVTRPTLGGRPATEPLPVVWTHSRYHRNPGQIMRIFGGGPRKIDSMVDARQDMQLLVRHGYVVAAVGARGSGASFGRFEGLFSEAETRDAVEVIGWLAEQSWCDGNVGMWGGSYLGITQYMAASKGPPALKAIFPDVAVFDMYDLLYPGGVFREDLIAHWDELTNKLDREWAAPEVDGDEDESLLRAAMAEHADNWQVLANYSVAPYRDHATDALTWLAHGPSVYLEEINRAQVPAYHFNGWFDVFVTDACLWFANYEGPQRLTIGAWAHGGVLDRNLMAERSRLTAIEQHRWFDRWLKGIENGVDQEPPVRFMLMEEPGSWSWQAAETWPPPGTEPVSLWFADGPAMSVDSINDGLLLREPEAEGADPYEVDPTTSTGTSSRWDNAVGAAPVMRYDDLDENDEKALTYTTPVLEEDLIVVGHPVVTLFVTASSDDADFHVLLEEVDAEGEVRYVSEGVLRASQRKLAEAPWENLGLPYQRCFAEDREPLPTGAPAELVLDLHPTANVFDAGHRLRLVIQCADADNLATLRPEEGAEVLVFRGGAHASRVELPLAQSE